MLRINGTEIGPVREGVVAKGYTAVLEVLLTNGAKELGLYDITEGPSPLTEAASKGHVDIVMMLSR